MNTPYCCRVCRLDSRCPHNSPSLRKWKMVRGPFSMDLGHPGFQPVYLDSRSRTRSASCKALDPQAGDQQVCHGEGFPMTAKAVQRFALHWRTRRIFERGTSFGHRSAGQSLRGTPPHHLLHPRALQPSSSGRCVSRFAFPAGPRDDDRHQTWSRAYRRARYMANKNHIPSDRQNPLKQSSSG